MCSLLFAQNAPYVYNVTGSQRTDGSKIVDIYYNVLEPDADTLLVTLQVSADDGNTFDIIPADSLLSGDIGEGIMSGNDKHIIWNAGEETLAFEGNTYKFKVIADDDPYGVITVTDIDGNVYQTVQIGDQLWMAENLKVTHYRNGDAIPTNYTNLQWVDLFTCAYCIYNDEPANADTYGNLYNWYAVDDSRNIAPEGWHVPTDEEIKEMEMALGMSQSQADATGWRGTNEGSKLAGNADLWTNGALENNAEFGTSGFSFLPGGYRGCDSGDYYSMSLYGYFWSASESGSYAWGRDLYYNRTDVNRHASDKRRGYSVRCVRD
jgi:uncharacterized protein (TIGR02145 family)